MTNKAGFEKFGISRNSILTWMKNKNKLLQSSERASSNIKKLRGCDYEQVGKVTLKWFSLQRSQSLSIGTMTKKMLFFAEKRYFLNFEASNGWMDKWKKR